MILVQNAHFYVFCQNKILESLIWCIFDGLLFQSQRNYWKFCWLSL